MYFDYFLGKMDACPVQFCAGRIYIAVSIAVSQLYISDINVPAAGRETVP